MNIDLKGKTAVVTGASGELGRVISRTLANCGARLALQYLSSEAKAQAVADEIAKHGGEAKVFRADVTVEDSVKKMGEAVQKAFGDPDIVVNNAVIQYAWTSVLDQNPADYESQFRSCVLHNVFMAKTFAPGMIKKKSGRIIAINTECAMQNAPSQSAYVSGKRGMDGVLRVLAREIGEHQITVNQVAPGWMISERYREAGTEHNEAYEKNVPLRRRGHDQDVANLVAYLASDLANFITGAYISVSGGNVMPTI